jgi:hypothetical protein
MKPRTPELLNETETGIFERLGILNEKIEMAHGRVDKMETLIRDDLKSLKNEFREYSDDLKEVVAWMNRAKGWAAAFLLVAGVIGGIVAKILK